VRVRLAVILSALCGCGVHPGTDAGLGGGGGSLFTGGGGGLSTGGGGGGSITGGGTGGGGAAGGGGGATGGGSGGGGGSVSPDGGVALRVFITSTTTHGDLGGLAGADQLCQDRANAAALNGSWKAWISTSTVNAKDHVVGPGPWVDMRGALLFADRTALTGFTGPATSIWYSETGTFLPTSDLWTATDITGVYRAYLAGTTPCEEWTSAAMTSYAQVGQSGRTGSAWTNAFGTSCDQNGRLICFEQ
jgi:hypothetical protein